MGDAIHTAPTVIPGAFEPREPSLLPARRYEPVAIGELEVVHGPQCNAVGCELGRYDTLSGWADCDACRDSDGGFVGAMCGGVRGESCNVVERLADVSVQLPSGQVCCVHCAAYACSDDEEGEDEDFLRCLSAVARLAGVRS